MYFLIYGVTLAHMICKNYCEPMVPPCLLNTEKLAVSRKSDFAAKWNIRKVDDAPMPQAESAVCLHLCLSQSLFLSPGCSVFQGTPSWLKSRNAAVGIGISFHPHNCQQVRAQHLQGESWQARSQLWLTLENNNNIHLGVWNYLSRLVEVLPKAKKKKKETSDE